MKSYSLNEIYSEKGLKYQKGRYDHTAKKYEEYFGEKPLYAFSAPGRTEIGGNHTDHNHGCVIAAGVSLDIVAFVTPTNDGIITFKSEGFPESVVDTSQKEPVKSEINSTAALIRGVSAGLYRSGYKTGGFRAYAVSDVLQGSGLSSSAAVEVLIGTILNGLYNEGKISAVEIAKNAGYAENVYFGKASGLMDQMASAVGGFVTIDFKNTENPVINPIKFDFTKTGYNLCIVDVKASHADLSDEYSSIPKEMQSVANFFGKDYLREISKEVLVENLPAVRKTCGDRAVLRALHFFDDSNRAIDEGKALENGDVEKFLKLVNQSGESSMSYLQNIFPCSHPDMQGMTMGIYTAKMLLEGKGAVRVHGGGFGGTIQAFVPDELLEKFVSGMEKVFGENCCYVPDIRPVGGVMVNTED